MSEALEEELEEELNDPGNEDPGSLMDDVQVPLIEDCPPSIESKPQEK
jgi:hypothetical protein